MSLPRLLVATTNPGKIREIRRALESVPVELVTLADIAAVPEPDETGGTFAENAAIKARAYAEASGLPTVAEDSGLAIDALDGRPGVASARYPGATYPEKFDGIYRELAGRPRPWTARFVCALAFVDNDDRLGCGRWFTCEGTVEGEIADEPSGQGGFGYDPIFFHPPFGTTLAEAPPDRKLGVSHRGRAFRAFRAHLARSLGGKW